MENFEFQKYRDNLARKIRQEPNKIKRREILTNVKITEEYREAKRLKYEEFAATQETKAQIERLKQYALEHYKEYAAFDPETMELLEVIRANGEQFKNETLPNVPDELINKVNSFIQGNKDEQIVILLKRTNFDYKGLLVSEGDEQTKVCALLEAILKAQSYDEAVEETRDKEIDFSGLEKDPDIPDVKEFVYRVFGAEH